MEKSDAMLNKLLETFSTRVAAPASGAGSAQEPAPTCLDFKNFESFVNQPGEKEPAIMSPGASHWGISWSPEGPFIGIECARIMGDDKPFAPVRISCLDPATGKVFFASDPTSVHKDFTFFPHVAVIEACEGDLRLETRTLFAWSDCVAMRTRVVAGGVPGLRWVIHGSGPWLGKSQFNTGEGQIDFTLDTQLLRIMLPANINSVHGIDYPDTPALNPVKLPDSATVTGYWVDAGPVTDQPIVVWAQYWMIKAEAKPILCPEKPVEQLEHEVLARWVATLFPQFMHSFERLEQNVLARWNKEVLAQVPWPADRQTWPGYFKAFHTIETIKYQGFPHSAADGLRTSCPSKTHYIGQWLWDAAFHAMAYALYDPVTAQDHIRLSLKFRDPNTGLVPDVIFFPGTPGGPQNMDWSKPPVLSWAALEIHRRRACPEFLMEVYQALKEYNLCYCGPLRDKNGDGLSEWGPPRAAQEDHFACWESGWDTSPRWDHGCSQLNALDLNCWIVADQRCLAEIAGVLGESAEAQMWGDRAQQRAELIEMRLWDEKSGAYYDQDQTTGRLTSVLTPATFLPLFAGIASPDRAERLVKEHLLCADEFWPYIPSVAYSHPAYSPTDYWRGPTWINLAYFTMSGLHRYGYQQEAQSIRKMLTELVLHSPHIGEYYNSRTGESLGAQQFGWSAAFFMKAMLGLERELP